MHPLRPFRFPSTWLCTAACVTLTLLISPFLQAQGIADSLAELSIEQLLNESVNSVTKKTTRQFDSPAAISVLSTKDIERSGATTLGDALRLVPGLNVGAVSASQYAISARGFSNVFANKMLVLVDGRAVYNPLFGGVFWDLQQPMLEDLDRVEVIRGPGGAVWGSNAMNGVINVVSRSSRDTQGSMAYLGGGSVSQTMAGARYGGIIAEDIYYRIFASAQSSDDYRLPNGRAAGDRWQSRHGGFRIDQYADGDTHLTWQADATVVDLDHGASDAYNFNTLGRWARELSGGGGIELQVYYDRTFRNEAIRSRYTSDTFDFTAQHHFRLGPVHDITWGLGYRFVSNSVEQTSPDIPIRNGSFDLNLVGLFVQDEWRMAHDKLMVTTGTRLEHNDYTGFEIQPSLRALFKPTEKQTVWTAISRAVRTPSALEGRDVFEIAYGAPFPGPGGIYVPSVVGNGDPVSEVLWAYEAGYRAQPHKRVSLDASIFYNHYTNLLSVEGVRRLVPGTPVGTAEIPFTNSLRAETYGGELSVNYSPADSWRLTASYSLLLADFHGSKGTDPELEERNVPTHQIVLCSSYDLSQRASLDTQLRYVDQIESVPAYVTADIRLLYHLTDRLDISLVAQNLFADSHAEQAAQPVTVTSAVPRGIYAKLTWRF